MRANFATYKAPRDVLFLIDSRPQLEVYRYASLKINKKSTSSFAHPSDDNLADQVTKRDTSLRGSLKYEGIEQKRRIERYIDSEFDRVASALILFGTPNNRERDRGRAESAQ